MTPKHHELCMNQLSQDHCLILSSACSCTDIPSVSTHLLHAPAVTCPHVSYSIQEHTQLTTAFPGLCMYLPSHAHCPTLSSVGICTRMSTELFSAGSCAHMATDHLSLCWQLHSKVNCPSVASKATALTGTLPLSVS